MCTARFKPDFNKWDVELKVLFQTDGFQVSWAQIGLMLIKVAMLIIRSVCKVAKQEFCGNNTPLCSKKLAESIYFECCTIRKVLGIVLRIQLYLFNFFLQSKIMNGFWWHELKIRF